MDCLELKNRSTFLNSLSSFDCFFAVGLCNCILDDSRGVRIVVGMADLACTCWIVLLKAVFVIYPSIMFSYYLIYLS